VSVRVGGSGGWVVMVGVGVGGGGMGVWGGSGDVDRG
jgi:hypothetical protein